MLRTTGCTNEVDYSKVSGERILPFTFVLDTEKSILNPETGQYQTFCYTVTMTPILVTICPNSAI